LIKRKDEPDAETTGPAFRNRIAAFDAGDFNKATLPVSDKQAYSFGQRLPTGTARISIGQRRRDSVPGDQSRHGENATRLGALRPTISLAGAIAPAVPPMETIFLSQGLIKRLLWFRSVAADISAWRGMHFALNGMQSISN
jgi:hypothetical protein